MKSKSNKSVKNSEKAQEKKTEFAPVSFVRICMSILYDSLLLVPIGMLCSTFAVLIHILIYGVPEYRTRIQWSQVEGVLFTMALIAAFFGYFIYCWTRRGQTLGMKTWRIMLVDAQTHQLISTRAALVRVVVALCSLVPFGLGFWSRFSHPLKRTWHDLASNSQLILLKKN